jgi:hypothetical protein
VIEDPDRLLEELWECLYVLVGSADIKARLRDASLQMNFVLEDQVPIEIVDDFASVKARLSEQNREISDEEGADLARRILSMYTRLRGGISGE